MKSDPAQPTRSLARARRHVALELARAAGAALALPLHAFDASLMGSAAREELRELCGRAAPPVAELRAPALPRRPLRIFLSCAEASGETHALALLSALRALAREQGAPPPQLCGLGGARLAAAGVELVGDPVSHAAMGFSAVMGALPRYLALVERASHELASRPLDLFLPVDSPALHVPLARAARAARVPVAHFVAPQLWAWAPWRARAYARAVDRVLCVLPFEAEWFARRGIAAHYVGHPLLDSLPGQAACAPPPLEPARLALLPGSRASVIERNLPWMLARALALRARHPGLALVLPHARAEQRALLERVLREQRAQHEVELALGELHTELRRCSAAFSVSGTVLLDLLHHRLPTVVVYRVGSRALELLRDSLLHTPWFASLNLLAGAPIVPEHAFAGAGPAEQVEHELERALYDAAWRRTCGLGLERAARRLGPAGACRRAAASALELVRATD